MIKSLAAAVAASLVATGAGAQPKLDALVDRLAQPYVDSDTVVGMTVGVIHGDDQAVRGFGAYSKADSRTPDGKTIFEIGSVSKVFTGLLLADAVVQGRVTLNTPVNELLPKGVAIQPRGDQPIALWHLSTHTSGLPRLPDNLAPSDPNNPYADYNGKQLGAFLNACRLRKRPCEVSDYSNLGAGLLGLVLAREQKTDYASLLQQRIAEPLGLSDTTIKLEEEQRSRLAPPHVEGGSAGHNWDFDTLAGCGAIRSTADDLLTFAKACLDPQEGELREAVGLSWCVHQKPIEEGDFAMGLGWHIAHDGQTRWHNGQTGGYHAAVFVNRPLKIAVVVLTNTATMEVDALAQDLVVACAGQNVKPREFEKAPEVSAEVLQSYAGKYRLAPGFEFTVSVEGDNLMVGLTGQPTHQVYPRSDTEWYYKVVDATLTFKVDGKGKCTAVELFQNGVRQTAKRIN
jgi:D-alanyl-D-alanine-carboxypeptidase/D-alanyl-D-alanine-endopeptidase